MRWYNESTNEQGGEKMAKFVKHFMFWTITIVVVTLAVMTGINSIRDGSSANAIVDGVLVIVLIATAYFVFCEIVKDEKN